MVSGSTILFSYIFSNPKVENMSHFKRAFFVLSIISILLTSCSESAKAPRIGEWHVILDLGAGKELPFTMEYRANDQIVFFNADEAIEMSDVVRTGDSILILHPVFEGVFKGIYTEETITGDFIKPSLDRIVPFRMNFGTAERFETNASPAQDVSGNWETVFSPNTVEDRYIAKGIFKQKESRVTGTFRTTTGDYRYLDGVVDGDSLKLSTFDGAHAFLFEARVSDSTMTGVFYSGNHWKEPFEAKRNEHYELPKADSLTFLKEGYERIAFSFPDTDGNMVSLTDNVFKDKVVIVQIMGTWCPNCLDESKYYTAFYNANMEKDIAIVALAFEYAKTEEKAIEAINKLRKALDIPYPILLAQIGGGSKVKANEKLPMLNHVLSYPTTIFIDKKGKVRKIHTGFNGPATGEKYTEFVNEFESFVTELEAE